MSCKKYYTDIDSVVHQSMNAQKLSMLNILYSYDLILSTMCMNVCML